MFVDAKDLFTLMQEAQHGQDNGQYQYSFSTFASILKNAVIATYMKIYSREKNENQVDDNQEVHQLSDSNKKRILRNSVEKVKLDLENSINKFLVSNRIVVLIDNLQDLPFGISSLLFELFL